MTTLTSRVLVIDGDPGILLTFAANLELAGLSVVTAGSPDAALDAMRTSGPFDLVVTDLRMDGMDGTTLLRKLRVMQPGVPVILATGYIHEQEIPTLLAEGVYTVITKPFEADHAVAIIEQAVRRPFVLVADEDGAEAERLAKGLTEIGLPARAVRSAGEALLVLRMDGVDICVAGVGLGAADGKTLPERIQHEKQEVGVIGLAPVAGADALVSRAATAGMFACVSKPVESPMLAQMIARARSRPRVRAAL